MKVSYRSYDSNGCLTERIELKRWCDFNVGTMTAW